MLGMPDRSRIGDDDDDELHCEVRAVKRAKLPNNPYGWELYWPGKQLPFKRSDERYRTQTEAEQAGQRALDLWLRARARKSDK